MPAERASLPDPVVCRLRVDGLEDLFEAAEIDPNDGGLTIGQAVHYFGKSKKQLKRQIRKGQLAALRIETAEGLKWRVFPGGVPERLTHLLVPNVEVAPPAPSGKSREKPGERSGEESREISGESPGQKRGGKSGPKNSAKSAAESKQVLQPKGKTGSGARVRKATAANQPEVRSDLMQESSCGADSAGQSTREAPPCSRDDVSAAVADDTANAVSEVEVVPGVQDEVGADELAGKLQAAYQRIGHLEAKITGLEDQVNYLTQSLHRPGSWQSLMLVIPVAAFVLALAAMGRF